MEEVVVIIGIIVLILYGLYLLAGIGVKVVIACAVPLLGGLLLGYYALFAIAIVWRWRLRCTHTLLGLAKPSLGKNSSFLSFDLVSKELHKLNPLAAVFASGFSCVAVYTLQAHTDTFQRTFEGHPIMQSVGVAGAWLFPVMLGVWFWNGGRTNGRFESIIATALKRRGFLGAQTIVGLREIDTVEPKIHALRSELGIAWPFNYRAAVERYVNSHPEILLDAKPLAMVTSMIVQLARNDLTGLSNCNEARKRALAKYQELGGLLTVKAVPLLADNVEECRLVLLRANSYIAERRWQAYESKMDTAVREMEILRQNFLADDVDEFEEDSHSDAGSNGAHLSHDPYDVLGVNRDAPDQDINAIRKRLLQIYHADVDSPFVIRGKDAEINEAYEQIMDERHPERRN